MRKEYIRQVALLVETVPFIEKEACFALKGGTAVNLFHRDMPRLSVDIDLTYLPFDDRTTAFANINAALSRIAAFLASPTRHLRKGRKGIRVRRNEGSLAARIVRWARPWTASTPATSSISRSYSMAAIRMSILWPVSLPCC